MAFTTTTLSGAVATKDKTIGVSSTTGFTAGRFVLVDAEFMQIVATPASGVSVVSVIRGLGGTAVVAHASGSNATVGDGSDFASPVAGVTGVYAGSPGRIVTSYGAAGAITLPTAGSNVVAVIDGTSALAMTVAAPTKDIDGCELTVVGNGGAAHTITFTGGLSGGGSSYDVLTLNATNPAGIKAVAVNGVWVSLVAPAMGGTVTNIIGSIG